MAKSQFRCCQVIPHWQRYEKDPFNNLNSFVDEMWDEVEAIQIWLESPIVTPKVQEVEEKLYRHLHAVNTAWDPDRAMLAALASVEYVVIVYKTAAAHFIMQLKKDIARKEFDETTIHYRRHTKAREHFGAALEIEKVLQSSTGISYVEDAHRCIILYYNAVLHLITEAFTE